MGCAPSKNTQLKLSHPQPRTNQIVPLSRQSSVVSVSAVSGSPKITISHSDDKIALSNSDAKITISNSDAKISILDSIKRGDLILFEKTMQNHQITPNEVIGPADQQKTILHYIAESNFADAMSYALEYVFLNQEQFAAKIINAKDSNGNTPAITCCIYDAPECLEILMKTGLVDVTAKNIKGQNGYEIAEDNDSNCASQLAMINLNKTQDTVDMKRDSVSQAQTPSNAKFNFLNPSASSSELSVFASSPGSTMLKSVLSIKNLNKLSSDTKLYQLLGEISSSDYVDEEFPHDNETIATEENLPTYLEKYKNIKWLRPTEIKGIDAKSVSLFEGIDVNQVSESPLAGCDLYSALAAMTEFPQRMLKIFTSKETSKQGAYSVQFLVSGIPLEILVDDYFPCTSDAKPIFSRPSSNEIWFMLIEKAFAKLYGTYDDVKTVKLTEALETMTGMPTCEVPLKDANKDDLWTSLTECDKKNFIYIASKKQNEAEKKNRNFPIVRVHEFEEHRIIKLRTPCKEFVWTGKYSDDSDAWTKELKEEVGYFSGDKNSFFMDIEEFTKQFETLTICHYQENWIRVGKEVTTSAKKAAFFEIDVDREMEVIISVHQQLPSFVGEEDYQISPVEILVGEKLNEEKSIKRVASGEKDIFLGKSTVFATSRIKMKLSEGRYIIRAKVRWVDGHSHSFALNAYSPHTLSLKRVKATKYPDFLETVYLDAGSRSGDKYQMGNRCEFGSQWCGSHLWLYGVNKGNKTWTLEINFNKLENLSLCKKYKSGENSIKLVIPANGKAVAYVKKLTVNNVNLNWTFNQEWEEPVNNYIHV